jgi:hypothetical protein
MGMPRISWPTQGSEEYGIFSKIQLTEINGIHIQLAGQKVYHFLLPAYQSFQDIHSYATSYHLPLNLSTLQLTSAVNFSQLSS